MPQRIPREALENSYLIPERVPKKNPNFQTKHGKLGILKGYLEQNFCGTHAEIIQLNWLNLEIIPKGIFGSVPGGNHLEFLRST